VNSFGTDAKILDAEAKTDSVMLPWLSQFGFDIFTGSIRSSGRRSLRKHIVYLHGDIEQTPFQERYFDAVTCLFALEHGIDIERYLSESWRILKPVGLLITSVCYWDSGVDAGDKTYSGAPVRIFSREDIVELVRLATAVGFDMIGDCGLECEQRVEHWREADLKYTFMILAMQK
jgi:SAM-dependent methyltransferase